MFSFNQIQKNPRDVVNTASQERYAEVVVNIPLNKTFYYAIPLRFRENLLPGMRVRVPFGTKTVTGFCVGFSNGPCAYKTKDIIHIIDTTPLLDKTMLRITKWLSHHYWCGWGEAIYAVIPPAVRREVKEKKVTFVLSRNSISTLGESTFVSIKKSAPKQAKALEILLKYRGEITARELIRMSSCTMDSLQRLRKKGFISFEDRSPEAALLPHSHNPPEQHLTFTPEQQNAFATIGQKLDEPSPGVILLHGITGSGKTELYLQAIAKVIESGRKVIFLVPEIALTSQTIRRIKARFLRVAILHSHLLGTFHHSQWNVIKENKVDIVIGARSSVFAPLHHVGLIIIDEEHENTYKQENTPRYNARDIAVLRATYDNALLILGTATPSLETYHNALSGNYEKIVLSKRVGNLKLPPIEIVDMREEARKHRGYHVISHRLEYYMKQALARNEQVILFLNRRGFAPYIHCKRCGFVLKCHRCDIPLTFHKKLNTTLCHYCHAEAQPLHSCPDCLAGNISYRGFGTEKVEEEIGAMFSGYKLLRMDSDSMRKRNAHEKSLDAFEQKKYQILLGTQMIAKGLDFPNVTLVGVISADTTLNIPDFRSSERTFQLISQVAGRTGRGPKGGRVLVQSYNPKHYSIAHAAAHDYDGFARKELEYRKQLNYPPFGKLARILFRSSKENVLEEKSSAVADKLKEIAQKKGILMDILGPSPAPITKINDLFRWHLLLKTQYHKNIHDTLRGIEPMLKSSKSIQAIVDVDPYTLV
ncbi:MAG: primosomal protein N' [Candidatus Brocadiaceae bacterium]|nr:primosomal protein N' [Candidatus Brocadiaceae bacterium]